MRGIRLVIVGGALAVGSLALPARAQSAPGEASLAPDAPKIALLTMGPGDHPFSKFGHIAIVVADPVGGREEVYNYGTFTFDSPWLIVDFLKGLLRYWLSIDSLSHTAAVYRQQRRSVLLQELAILPDRSRALAAFLRENARPENRYYRYDYYLDNCSTRVRDALDRAVGGRIRAASGGPARLTFREHTLRLVADDFPLYAALDVVMGPFIDQPVTRWDEAFLPDELAKIVRGVRVPTASGDGPLVTRELVLATSDRAERSEPPDWTWRFGAAGTLAGAAAVALVKFGNRRAARVLLAIAQTLLGIVSGFLGIVFMLLWVFTDHRVAYQNENLLLCPPIALAFAAVTVGVGRGRAGATRWSFRLSTALAMLATLALLLKGLLRGGQANGHWIAFFLPLWWGIAAANWMAWRALFRPVAAAGMAWKPENRSAGADSTAPGA